MSPKQPYKDDGFGGRATGVNGRLRIDEAS